MGGATIGAGAELVVRVDGGDADYGFQGKDPVPDGECQDLIRMGMF